MEAICDSLEIEKRYVDEDLKLDSSFQLFATNLYPPCPQPDRAIGLPPHTDPGLFTFLIHNGVAGLQIEHDGKWFNADSPSNSILVNVADQLQVNSLSKVYACNDSIIIIYYSYYYWWMNNWADIEQREMQECEA